MNHTTKKSLIIVGGILAFLVGVVAIIIVLLNTVFYEDNGSIFNSDTSLPVEMRLVEENGTLYLMVTTEDPLDDAWVNAGYDGYVYAGRKVLNDESGEYYANREVEGGYEHRMLGLWTFEEAQDQFQIQLGDVNSGRASAIYTVDVKHGTLERS